MDHTLEALRLINEQTDDVLTKIIECKIIEI